MTRYRVGNGLDAHRLVDGRPLMLGGVHVPFERGLEGHSDADCVLHALCDALLGAMGEGDMGRLFPSADPQWKGADSLVFVAEVARRLDASGWELENADVTVVAQRPVLAPHTPAMRDAIAGALGVESERISVKAKSTDGLGAFGRGEGIAALASVLLRQDR
ncbi:MAG TPA: 2-C-methyl-D-erythritol 2,4-cyclodiphosphate synthase [Vicinamibacteria bacterium]|nr:2-C-methyl-D-erythritol 2,4-cyclodiphosphate synthase [Vicinamibacteria bacterium]